MATLTLKQVPQPLLERLRAQAKRERRSINQQVLLMIEQALAQARPSFAEAYERWRSDNAPIEPEIHAALRGLRSRSHGRRVRL